MALATCTRNVNVRYTVGIMELQKQFLHLKVREQSNTRQNLEEFLEIDTNHTCSNHNYVMDMTQGQQGHGQLDRTVISAACESLQKCHGARVRRRCMYHQDGSVHLPRMALQ